MRILCLHAPSQYQLMNAFLDAVGDGFRASGHQVMSANLQEISPPGPPSDLVFSFGGVGADVGLGRAAADVARRQPVWTPELYDLQVEKDGLLVVAGEHVEVLHDFLGVPTPTGFVPHGIEVDPRFGEPDFSDRTRDIDVLVAGSFAPKPQPPWKTSEPTAAATLKTTLQLADERWDHHVRELEVSGLFLEAAQAHGFPCARGPSVVRTAARVARRPPARPSPPRRRVRALRPRRRRRRTSSGWAGNGSPTSNTPRSRARSATASCHELVRRTKIVANVGPPLFNIGWHERVPLGMAHGAFVVTETNDWLTEEPEFRGTLRPLRNARARRAGRDRPRRPRRPDPRGPRPRGLPVVVENHTWAGRAKTILEIVEV